MKRLLRLALAAGVTAAAYFLAGVLGIDPLIFLVPCGMMLVNLLLWDTLKCSILDAGFFRFIKFLVLVGTMVVGCYFLFVYALPMVNEGLFDLNATYTSLQICAVTGAFGMLAFTFVLCLGCVESFGNRFVGPFTSLAGILVGLLWGLLVYFLGAISLGVARFLAWAILALPLFVLFAYIKHHGLLYADVDMDAAFQGLGIGGGGSGARPQKTGNALEDAMRQIAWSESRLVNLHYNNQVKLQVSVYVYSYSVEFEISGTIYSNNPNMTHSQISEVTDQLDFILSQTQNRILRDAQRKAGGSYDVRVSIGSVD